MSKSVFELRAVSRSYFGTDVLNISSLSIAAADIFCLLGPSGSGKSTFLRIANLVEAPNSGEVTVFGEQVDWGQNLLAIRRRMAMVFQEPLLFNTTVFKNIAYGLRVRGLNGAEVSERVHETAGLVGIGHLLNRHANLISGGEAHRVALARALAVEPEVILLDEPFASLDVLTKIDLQTELVTLIKDRGITAIVVTHDQQEAMEIGDTIAVLDRGRIQQIGTPEEMYLQPKTEFVARFFGVENIMSGKVIGQNQGLLTISINGAEIEAIGEFAVGEDVRVFIRAEDISIGRHDQRRDSIRNHCFGRIVDIRQTSAVAKVKIECAQTMTAMITRRSLEDLDLKIGDPVSISFKATAVRVIKS